MNGEGSQNPVKYFSLENWLRFWKSAGAAGNANAVFDLLRIAYTSSNRAYHNEEHIAHCLKELESARHLAKEPHAVEMALWCHDVIYVVGEKSNEELSSHWAYDIAVKYMSMGADFGEQTKKLILLTETESIPEGIDSMIVHDCDWAILGSRPRDYDDYERGIMREFGAIMSAKAYRQGRIEFLRSVLGPEPIFHVDRFREKYEKKARQNVRRALSRLDSMH